MLQRITLVFLVLALGTCAMNRHQLKQETAGIFGIYGNWCGPDYPKTMDPPPSVVDQLDATCLRHNYCYAKKGYLNCDCDKVLVTELKHDISSGIYDAEQRRYASSFAKFFQGSPCEQTKANRASKAPKEGVVKKVFNTTKAGLRKFIDLVGGDEAQATPTQEQKNTDVAVGGGGSTAQQSLEQEFIVDEKSPVTAQLTGTQKKTMY